MASELMTIAMASGELITRASEICLSREFGVEKRTKRVTKKMEANALITDAQNRFTQRFTDLNNEMLRDSLVQVERNREQILDVDLYQAYTITAGEAALKQHRRMNENIDRFAATNYLID